MKERLDVLLVQKGLAPSREKARAMIMAGKVYVGEQKEEKAGTFFDPSADIQIRGDTLPFVSRGGLKLDKALRSFPVQLQGRICMDVGASTGGFTDCMLQNGAALVYAVDVGYGQLAWSLRQNEKVVCMEKTNIRYLTPDRIAERPDFFSIDVSFISLTLVLPAVLGLAAKTADIVALIKPQFEAGREKVGKKGVVKDPAVHREVITKVMDFAKSKGLTCMGLDFSPVKGPEGNIEYLLWLHSGMQPDDDRMEMLPAVEEIVAKAHESLDRN